MIGSGMGPLALLFTPSLSDLLMNPVPFKHKQREGREPLQLGSR